MKGRVHTTWGYSAGSGQPDSRKPNILNASKHTRLGQRFRRAVEAKPGHVLVETDVSAYHICSAGYLAIDAEYIDYGKSDPHSIASSWFLCDDYPEFPEISMGWGMSKILSYAEEFKANKKTVLGYMPDGSPMYFKQFRQRIAKPFTLGDQLGRSDIAIWRANKKYMSRAQAAEYQHRMHQRTPKVQRMKRSCMELAQRQGYLVNAFGRVQPFTDVIAGYRDDGTIKQGEQANEALAFMVQSTAFDHMLEMLMRCHDLYGDEPFEKYGFINNIFDSVLSEPREEDALECVAWHEWMLTQKSAVLVNEACPEGFSVKVESSIGWNWAEYDEKENVKGQRGVEEWLKSR